MVTQNLQKNSVGSQMVLYGIPWKQYSQNAGSEKLTDTFVKSVAINNDNLNIQPNVKVTIEMTLTQRCKVLCVFLRQ